MRMEYRPGLWAINVNDDDDEYYLKEFLYLPHSAIEFSQIFMLTCIWKLQSCAVSVCQHVLYQLGDS
jgi:hypothetical protein